jgi:hypothetical protein
MQALFPGRTLDLQLEAISQIAGIGLNTLGVIWIGQHWPT